jgi:signal peptidase I
MFQPKFLKQAKQLHKGVTRFLHYKRDLLPKAKLEEIEGQSRQLEEAIKARDEKRLEDLAKTINTTCERALPEARSSAIAENIEVFFVSIVIALGIRAYIAQPFQIPTGSMQPTLNGITAEPTKENPDPGIVGKALGWVTGTTYLNAVSDHDGDVDISRLGDNYHEGSDLTEHHFLIMRPYSKLQFTDGHTMTIDCPHHQLIGELDLEGNLRRGGVAEGPEPQMQGRLVHVKEGQVLARGLVHDGDHVIVNKLSYNFRKPTRGEVFVFTTKNIASPYMNIPVEQGSQHYIKRLVGLPGDTVDVQSPELYINGEKATEPGIRRVIDQRKPVETLYSYHGYSPPPGYIPMPITLATTPDREYFAMGDNSYNSSDSRYWGPVPEQNVVGPGLFCYWPLTKHWGVIY